MIEGTLEEQAQFIEGLLGIDRELRCSRGMMTNLVHGYDEHDVETGGISAPIHMSSTFAHPSFDGSTGFMYQRRFAKTNPEYFCLLPNGKRDLSEVRLFEGVQPGQLCWSSGVVEVAEDGKSCRSTYLTPGPFVMATGPSP